MLRRTLTLLLPLHLLAAGCGPSTPPGAAVGEPCQDGADCQDGLFCLVPGPDQGACEPIPASCGDPAECSSGCFDAYNADCPNGSACIGINGAVTHACQ